MAHIFPSLLGMDLLNIQKEIEGCDPCTDGYQFDVMDNHFVNNLTYGQDLVNAVDTITRKKIWVHLMIDDPLSVIERLTIRPGSIISVHVEAVADMTPVIDAIHAHGWQASIALNPHTSIESVWPLLPRCQQLLIMSVQPGFSGQPFIPTTLSKIAQAHAYRTHNRLPLRIGIDGGVKREHIRLLIQAGIDDIAIASAIWGAKEPTTELCWFYEQAHRTESKA